MTGTREFVLCPGKRRQYADPSEMSMTAKRGHGRRKGARSEWHSEFRMALQIMTFVEQPELLRVTLPEGPCSVSRESLSGSKQGAPNELGYERHNSLGSNGLRNSECHSGQEPNT